MADRKAQAEGALVEHRVLLLAPQLPVLDSQPLCLLQSVVEQRRHARRLQRVSGSRLRLNVDGMHGAPLCLLHCVTGSVDIPDASALGILD